MRAWCVVGAVVAASGCTQTGVGHRCEGVNPPHARAALVRLSPAGKLLAKQEMPYYYRLRTANGEITVERSTPTPVTHVDGAAPAVRRGAKPVPLGRAQGVTLSLDPKLGVVGRGPDRAVRWQSASHVGVHPDQAVVLGDVVVVAGSDYHRQVGIIALAAADGRVLWKQVAGYPSSRPLLLPLGGAVLATGNTGNWRKPAEVVAYSPHNGAVLWRLALPYAQADSLDRSGADVVVLNRDVVLFCD